MSELIKIVQLPVIEEKLRTLKDLWEQRALDAESMVCTEDTIQAVKAFRADIRREFDEVEALRKQVKRAVMEPYEYYGRSDSAVDLVAEGIKQCGNVDPIVVDWAMRAVNEAAVAGGGSFLQQTVIRLV